MRDIFFGFLRLLLFADLVRMMTQRRQLTIVLLHKPSVENFEKTVSLLQSRYNLVSLGFVENKIISNQLHEIPNYPLIITLDDGDYSNYSLLPSIKQYNWPISIFLCSELIRTGDDFWFTQVRSKKLKLKLKKITNARRKEFLEGQTNKLGRRSMNLKEILEMSNYVDFQSHTESHPILPMCTDKESLSEICNSKVTLETLLNKQITSIAFPNGDYTLREIEYARKSGYKFIFKVAPNPNNLEILTDILNRIPLSDRFGKNEVIVKTSGVYELLKQWISG